MTTFKKWSEVKATHVERIGIERIQNRVARLTLALHMQPLVDKRKSLHLTQKDVAEHMGITVGRVSQIEAGEVAGIDVLERYINALGGTLQLSATFSD